MVETTLQHLIYGQPVNTEEADILAISPDLAPEDASELVEAISLAPLPNDNTTQSQAVAYVAVNGTLPANYVLARVHYQQETQSAPVYQYVLLTNDIIDSLGTVDALMPLINTPIERSKVTNHPVDALDVPTPTIRTIDQDTQFINDVLATYPQLDMKSLLGLLGAVMTKHLNIVNFPADNAQRLNIIKVLTTLLPSALRSTVTFTTQAKMSDAPLPDIAFVDNPIAETTRYQVIWDDVLVLDDALYQHPYIAHLVTLYAEQDITALLENLATINIIATALRHTDLSRDDILTRVANRHQLDMRVIHGDTINLDTLRQALDSDVPMTLELRTAYIIHLLESHFDTRDAEIARYVAQALEADSLLDNSVNPFLDTSIEEQPDAVYAFMRVWLNTKDDVSEHETLLNRLHRAAEAAVAVAIDSGDAATICSWLTLIAREPLRYGLSDILREGISKAQPYASQSADLAQELLVLAIKRQPDMIDDLLTDDALVATLPENQQKGLLQFDLSALISLADSVHELFLLGIKRVLDAESTQIGIPSVRALWKIHTETKTNTLPPQFRPATLIQQMVNNREIFVEGTLPVLLTLIATNPKNDDLFYAVIPPLAEENDIAILLSQAFQKSGRKLDDVMRLQSNLLAKETVSAQTIVNSYARLLENRNWEDSLLPIVEQLARVMTQHPDTTAPTGILWKLTELSAAHKNEQMLKVALRRLLSDLALMTDEAQIVESVQRLRKDTQWNVPIARPVILRWWRTLVREKGTGQLQKFDKALDSKRQLEDMRAIVQTNIAMRRVIGTQSLEEFANAVSTTYNLLQALSEGFDTSNKLVDSTSIRQEMDSRTGELPEELRPVLSTNLKELANLVTVLSEHRSKAGLIRGDVERQLVTGEQQPQSAIDVMRWLSGYLDGLQKDESNE